MIIQHNMLAMNNLIVGKQLQKSKAKNMERLSSGYRINRAADDAANMAISEKMHSRIRALARCQQNIEEGISLAQTADGALHEVNNMLNRAAELCVQAANDTNTTEDRSKIAAEITQIYDEMDRVFETTEFNTMKIFRHDGDNYYGPDPEYLYHESVTELPPGDLHSWGTGMFPTKQFDLAKGATAATATLTLADGVDLNDATTLDGTSFMIKKGNSTYKIEFGTAQSTGSTNNGYYVNTNSYNTVQRAFNAFATSYPYNNFIESVTVSGNQVNFEFTMPEETKQITFKTDTDADGVRETITAQETVNNGAKNNGISIYCEGNTLNPIDSGNNALSFNKTISQTFYVMKGRNGTDVLTEQEKNNISQNSIVFYEDGTYPLKITLSKDSISTVDSVRQAVLSAINAKDGFSASYNSADDSISVNYTLSKTGADKKATFSFITEENNSTSVLTESTSPLGITITQDIVGTSEKPAKYTLQLPSITNDGPYSVKIKDQAYTLYSSSKYASYGNTSITTSPYTYVKSSNDLNQLLRSCISAQYGSDYTITDNHDGTLTLTAKKLNDNSGISITDYPTTLDVSTVSKDILLVNPGSSSSNYKYFTQTYSVSFNIGESVGDPFDSSALLGKGFMLNNTYYQFADSSMPLYNNATKRILVTDISSYAELCTRMTEVTGITDIVQDPPDSGTITLSVTRDTEYASGSDTINFSDGGPSGTFSTNAVSSGGTAYKNPQAEIDFSKYDMDNLDELYGTGFRLTCATCPGEFVNVVFCHDKSELNYPASFEYTDANGNTNTIHNYMVELKDVTHGSQIAANIADQLKNDLDHFTEVKVSDTNPSILIAQDKRSLDQSGRGQVLAGVYTNFLYNVLPEKLPNLGDKVGGGRKDTDAYYAYCMIYAGDTKEKPYIPVHLPHFSVENLKLEYPKEPWDSYEEITDVMNRSRNAAEVVSMARSKIGADQNRLEHAFDYAANAEEQIAAANSRIEDTDMAEAVTTQAKLTILSNSQEAMLSQIVDLPERILPLLQQ